MTDLASLEDERERLLTEINKYDAEIDQFERAMLAGDASLGRGLPYLRDLNEGRTELFWVLGKVEARIEYQMLQDKERSQQTQEKRDEQDWKDDPKTVGAARVPDAIAAHDDRDWWKNERAESVANVDQPAVAGDRQWWDHAGNDGPTADEPDLQVADERYKR